MGAVDRQKLLDQYSSLQRRIGNIEHALVGDHELSYSKIQRRHTKDINELRERHTEETRLLRNLIAGIHQEQALIERSFLTRLRWLLFGVSRMPVAVMGDRLAADQNLIENT